MGKELWFLFLFCFSFLFYFDLCRADENVCTTVQKRVGGGGFVDTKLPLPPHPTKRAFWPQSGPFVQSHTTHQHSPSLATNTPIFLIHYVRGAPWWTFSCCACGCRLWPIKGLNKRETLGLSIVFLQVKGEATYGDLRINVCPLQIFVPRPKNFFCSFCFY